MGRPIEEGRRVTPPDLPPATPPVSRKLSRREDYALREEDLAPIEGAITPLRAVDALLKRPGCVVYETMKGRPSAVATMLLGATVLCLLAYGTVMGSFSAGAQLWAVPVKVAGGVLLSALICLPSLYIFAALSGGRQSFAQTGGMLIHAVTLGGMLLVGFAPIVWIFSQSTHAVAFMGALHFVFWMIAVYFGLRLLVAESALLNGRRSALVKLWSVVFIAVLMQMSTTLRPLVGESSGLELRGKKFFLLHWGEWLLGHGEKPERGAASG
jgi:hypothetical protein